MEESKRKVLGKGLNALISNTYNNIEKPEPTAGRASDLPQPNTKSSVATIPIRDIIPNRDQPRLMMQDQALAELAESIKAQGILQPVIVTQKSGKYELICGERRMRAATLAGLTEIPAVIKDVSEDKLLELALVENIQREDLNPIEEAVAYSKLIEKQNITQEEVAKRVGKERSSVTNTLRLLRLPQEVQDMVAGGLISHGHARTLVSLLTPEHQRVLAQRIVKENLSVRQTEEIAQGMLSGKKKAKKLRQLNAHIQDLERKLEQRLGTHVRVFNNRKNQGRIEIRYFSLDDLDRILESLQIEHG